MKTKLRCPLALGVALLISNASVEAQPQAQYQGQQYQSSPYYASTGHFYINADIGGSLLQSVSIKNLNTRVGFEPGTRGDISFGYNVVDSLAVELETGVIWNSFTGSGAHVISPAADHAELYQVPIMGNIIFKAPLKCGLTPYIGAGAGGVIGNLELRHEDTFDTFSDRTWDSDFTFAYQGIAGLKYTFGWNMEVGVGYKFLGTLDHRWFGNDPNLYIHTSPTLSHSFLASFTWRF